MLFRSEAGDDLLSRVLGSGAIVHREEDGFSKADGSSLPVAHTCSPIVTGGEVVGAVLVFHDITDRRQMEERRQHLLVREQGARERETRAEEGWTAARSEIAALDTETGALDREVQELERTRGQWTDALAERRVAGQQLGRASCRERVSSVV